MTNGPALAVGLVQECASRVHIQGDVFIMALIKLTSHKYIETSVIASVTFDTVAGRNRMAIDYRDANRSEIYIYDADAAEAWNNWQHWHSSKQHPHK